MKRAAALLLLAASLASGNAIAAPPAVPEESAPAAPSSVSVEASPLFTSITAAGTVVPSGWNEVLVRVQNRATEPLKGEIRITDRQVVGSDPQEFAAVAPFSVSGNASIHVRIPVDVTLYSTLTVEVKDERGLVQSSTNFSTYQPNGVVLVDISEPSRVREAVDGVPVAPRFVPPWASARGGSSAPTLSVVSPRFDPATGDPLLPDRAALYAPADAVVVRSDVLARLAGDELDALAKFVLGGGTLAVAVVRPEDLRHATLVAFAGGSAITETSPSAEVLDDLLLPVPATAGASGARPVPGARRPSPETTKTLVGHAGGNLHGSAYGNSATYGLGEVHLLAFDPSKRPAMDDAWAHVRLVDLARRAHDRRTTLVFRSGTPTPNSDYTLLRKQLDPNESSRWAIAAAAILLCLYAALAGPFNFARASRRQKPLRALWHLPIYAAGAFAIVLAIGAAAKGVRGRARHLTLVEAGAGMQAGSARRFRAFYAARSENLTVRTTDRSSVVSTAIFDNGQKKDTLLVDRDGARLVDVAALPWETVIVREDGTVSLGDGISVTADGGDDAVIKNRSGRAIRGAVLVRPNGTAVYLGAIADGDKATSRSGQALSKFKDGATWEAHLRLLGKAGLADIHALDAADLHGILDDDATGLADAWLSIEKAGGEGAVDWFPTGVPVLIAQLDGGEGKKSDSGLGLESDRLLVRVVGFGGKPVSAAMPLQSTEPAAIRVRHLWHRFGMVEVLRDVTFEVGPGEIFGFIGPNGAGKTTTIRVMATLLEPMAGRVEVDGIDVTLDPDEVRRRIGYMPDTAGVYERITVREYLEFFADAFQVQSIGIVDTVLELTDMSKIQDRLVATMSKGQKQRLQLGRILLHDPKVLILDEPASDLDPRARIEIRDLLLELRGLGKTIFLSSHILTELADVCTSIGILERGRLVVAGPIHSIASRLEQVRAAEAVGHVGAGSASRSVGAAPPLPPVQTYGPPRTFHDDAPPIAPPPDGSWASDAAAPQPPMAMAIEPAPAVAPPGVERRRVKLKILGDPSPALRLLAGGPGILDVQLVGGAVLVTFVGGDAKIVEMVRHLVHNGAPLAGVEPERNELERIFLEVTRGEPR